MFAYANNNPVMNVDPSGLDAITWLGGMLTETYNWATTNQSFNWAGVNGALYDGYNGEGSYGTVTNIALALGNDALSFGTSGVGSVAKNSVQLAIREVPAFINATRISLPEIRATGSGAESASQAVKLSEYYRQLEKFGGAGVKELQSGNLRLYGELRPVRNSGEMVSARLVREWNPSANTNRTWYETLDQAGRVRSVAPKPVTESLNHRIFDINGRYVGRR